MKRSLTRVVAVGAVCAAALAGTTTVGASAAPQHRAASGLSKFAYKGNVFGAKVLVDGVELRNLKDAYAAQPCTRDATRAPKHAYSTLSVPDNDLVHASGLTSYTQTYQNAAKGLHGIRGVATVGDLALGATDGSTPQLSLKGFQSIANAYYDATANGGKGAFRHQETFTAPTLAITNLPDSIPPELQDLLDTLTQTGGQITGQVVSVIQQATGGIIDIPGLGSIGILGTSVGAARANSAYSQTYALRLEVDATGHPTVLELGHAATRIARPVPAGVFRSTAMGLDMFTDSALHLGNLGQRSIPCEGTHGKTVRQHLADASVLGGAVSLQGIDYAFMGKQLSNGAGRGFVTSNLDKLTVDSIGLEIDGIKSTVRMYKPAGTTRVQKQVVTSIGKIMMNGQPVTLPTQRNQSVDLGNGNVLTYKVVHPDYYGAEVHAVELTIPSLGTQGSILNLGWAAGKIFAR
ncbi:MAG: hypothetical protein ACXVWZ_03750 [Nocardioides sp.]